MKHTTLVILTILGLLLSSLAGLPLRLSSTHAGAASPPLLATTMSLAKPLASGVSIAATDTITITAGGFEPTVLTVQSGSPVTWTNATDRTHILVSGVPYHVYLPLVLRSHLGGTQAAAPAAPSAAPPAGPGDLFRATLAPGASFSYTFNEEGTFAYFLATAPEFEGTVIVASLIAPPLDEIGFTGLADATSFLYTGPNPIQTGVISGTIEAYRAAVLRGRVIKSDGMPLPGVTVTVLDHPEFGQTLTRADGMFDLAVNGGAALTVSYEKPGYLPAQRQGQVLWDEYVWLPDVAMIGMDPNTTLIDLSADIPVQVARGSVISDTDGLRQQTLFFPQGTTAYLSFADGMTQTITTMHVRATEYTVGPSGEEAMPAELPPNTAYTYASVFHADEALAAGAQDVWFNPPILSYVENFAGFDTGVGVPMGYYDDQRGMWVPIDSGRVIEILSVAGGLADLDIDGSGAPAGPAALAELGVTDAERAKLAELYTVGQSLWRVPVPHFDAPWDQNMGTSGKPPADPPPLRAPVLQRTDDPCLVNGSVIECQNQVLGESVGLVGTPFTLDYQSSRVPGYRVSDSIRIPLSGAELSPTLLRIELTIEVAGQRHSLAFAPQPDLYYDFVWDRKDAYGRTVQGSSRVSVGLDYIYPLVYQYTDRFGYNGNGSSGIFASTERAEFRIHNEWRGTIGTWKPPAADMGGWRLSVHHAYDPQNRTLFLGSGGQRSVDSINADVIDTVAGGGCSEPYSCGDGGPATEAGLNNPTGVAAGPDGSIYISTQRWDAYSTDNRLRKVDPQGIITTIAGGNAHCPRNDPCGDGGPAILATMGSVDRVTVGPDGSLYIADAFLNRVRKIDPDGIINTIAGTGVGCSSGTCGDGGPATEATLSSPNYAAVAPDGSLYITEVGLNGNRVRRVGTDGMISTVAGTGSQWYSGDGGPATQAGVSDPFWVAFGPDGSLYIAEHGSSRIRRVAPDGIISTIAGNVGPVWPCPDAEGDLATKACLPSPTAVVLGPDGSLYVAASFKEQAPSMRVRRISPDGIITTVAGTGWPGFGGDGGPARQAQLNELSSLSLGPGGDLHIADRLNKRIRRVRSAFPGGTGALEIAVPAEDGGEVYIFSAEGRHLRTLNALTGAIRYQFAYDAQGHLLSVTDGDGNVTTVTRDADGKPTGVVAPFGQVTTFTRDADGYLAGISNPAGETIGVGTAAGGLMTSYRDARGSLHTFEYDPLGRLVKDLDPAAGFKELARVEGSQAYSVTLSTALGRTTHYRVEKRATGTKRQVNTYPNGLQSEFQRRTDGTTLYRAPDGTLNGEVLGPDPRWGMLAPVTQQITMTTPAGLEFNAQVTRQAALAEPADPFSLVVLTETTAVNGKTYTGAYTAATRTWVDQSPAGRVVTTTLDAQGRVVAEQVAGLAPATYTYDGHGRLIAATAGAGAGERTVTLTYDGAGYLAGITDPLNRSVSIDYDLAGRLTLQTLPDGRVVGYTYDPNGNLASLTPPGRPAHGFDYTPVDLVSRYAPPDVNPGSDDTLYAYNPDRQATLVTRPDGQTIASGYDGAGRLDALAIARGILGLTYDAQTGNLAAIDAPGGIGLAHTYDGALLTGAAWSGPVAGTTAYTYDNDLRLASSDVNGSSTITYGYDADSLLTQAGALALNRNARNGLLTGSTLGSITDTWSYNGWGEPIDYTAGALFSVQYERDKLGRIVTETESISGTTDAYVYAYDLAGRLSGVTKNGAALSAYTYDGNGNRLTYTSAAGTVNGTYDAQDRLLQYGATTYTYTANGELLSKMAGGLTTGYQYDELGNLVGVTLPDGAQIDYLVDGQSRRMGKKVNGVPVQGFLYDGQLRPAAELDGRGAVVSRFVYATRVNVPDYMIKNGVTYRLILDHLGSPRLVVNAADGSVSQRLDYDEFGRVLLDTNPGFQPFGFAGGQHDPDTGLVRFGARDYDAETGRWTAKDPIGFAGGDNLFAYVENNPANKTDPNGQGKLACLQAAWVCWDCNLQAERELCDMTHPDEQTCSARGEEVGTSWAAHRIGKCFRGKCKQCAELMMKCSQFPATPKPTR